MSNDTRGTGSARPRGRSPAYPAISLEKALVRARQLWLKEKQYSVPVSAVVQMWGYSTINGSGGLAVSAMKKFGLANEEGSKEDRTISITDLAVQIFNHPSSDARLEATKESALLPPIHREMWDLYGAALPSDANLSWKLVRERGFTDTGAKEFLREYRETMEFAKLGGDDASNSRFADVSHSSEMPDETPDEIPNETPDETADERPRENGSIPFQSLFASFSPLDDSKPATPVIQNYPIPIAQKGRPPVVISGAFPLSAAEWDQFTAVLTAMKPVLTTDPATSETEGS